MFANFRRNVNRLIRSDASMCDAPALAAGAVYALFQQEFLLHGCPYAAYQFGEIVSVELQLTLHKLTDKRMSDVSALLCWLLDNGIAAEKAYRRGDTKALLRSLQDIVDGLVLLGEPFEWLLRKCYELMFLLAKRVERHFDANERMVADLHYHFAVFLCDEKDYAEALAVLGTALPMVRHRDWPIVEKDACEVRTLHEAVCCQMTTILLRSSELQMRHNPAKSLQLAEQAVRTIDEVGRMKYRVLLCHSHLQFAIAMHENDRHRDALKQLKHLQSILHQVTSAFDGDSVIFANLRCRLFICMGSCYISIGDQMEEYLVHRCIADAFTLAQTHKMRRCEAEVQMLLGKWYAKSNKVRLAEKAYKMAEMIFREVGNYERRSVCTVLRAKLCYDEIFPQILDAVRTSKCEANSMMNMMPRHKADTTALAYNGDEAQTLNETKRSARFKTTLPPIVEEDEEDEAGAEEKMATGGDGACHGAIGKTKPTRGHMTL